MNLRTRLAFGLAIVTLAGTAAVTGVTVANAEPGTQFTTHQEQGGRPTPTPTRT